MMRQHWLLWRQATFWGVLIALLLGLQQLNSWPLLWMNYDTAVPASGFAIRQIMSAIGIFGAFAVLLTISFMAAETLSRRAFPHHIQLWKVWSRPVASTRAALAQTSTGYLLVAPFFAYEIVLYFFAQGKLGWWTPSDTLVNPDMFGNYLPSLSAIAQAAQAGFWEECLFRAAPLAIAALIGDRFGKRRLFLAVAMVLQAVVFASGHAGYANQPAYARVVELILPSFAFGTIYLLFGLLPGIVLHFAYDTAWMALPLFVSSGTRAHLEQAIVVAAVLVPLWVVLVNRARAGGWSTVPDTALNGAWRPRELDEPRLVAAAGPIVAAPPLSSAVARILPLAGLVGLIVWTSASSFHTDAPPVRTTRKEAEQKARQELAARNVQLDPTWTVLGRVEGQPGEINRFVWQTAGRDRYEKLLGVYVTPPSWIIRFARFTGDVAERAEEYQVYIDGGGNVFRVNHDLPEARAGKSLMEDDARTIARASLNGSEFGEVSAVASKKPARTDWTFTFKDNRDYGLPQGEPRVSVEIAGDEVADMARFVYVPEEWSRNERNQRNLPTIFSVVCTIVVVAIVVGGAVVGVIHWSRRRPFSARAFFIVFSILFVAGALNGVNNWPVFASQALTAQPLGLQIAIIAALSLVVAVFTAAGLALVAGLVEPLKRVPNIVPRNIVLGLFLGLALAGVLALARHATPATSPAWGNLASASTFAPVIGAGIGPLSGFFTQTLIFLTVLYAISWRPRWAYVLWIVVGIALAGSSSIETLPSWLMIGAITGIALAAAYNVLFRSRPELLPVTTATLTILATLRDGLQRSYPAALAGSIAAAVLVTMAAWVWIRLGLVRAVTRHADDANGRIAI